MHAYAQTNIQLYNQLRRGRYSELELERIRNAYDLAIVLFSGHFRPNGKAFISHLVGTASILIAQNAASTVVIAGLLHAAYTNGVFPDSRRGVTTAKRDRVRSIVGTEAEKLIARYTQLRWNHDSIVALRKQVGSLDAEDRDVVIIRLANELEDHLDLGMLYSYKTNKKCAMCGEDIDILCELAESMGLDDLAKEVASTLQATEAVDVPTTLVSGERNSYVLNTLLRWRLIRLFNDKVRALRFVLGGDKDFS